MAVRAQELREMQQDVRAALKKPPERRSWVMVINVKKCVGCFACTVACEAENYSPPGVSYRVVPEVELGEFPQVSRLFMPTNCMQCDNPPCAPAAPPGAITKRPDGIVVIDYHRFRGREAFDAAAKACPYTALYYDDGTFFTRPGPVFQPYERGRNFEYLARWGRDNGGPPKGSGRKCHFCLHRLEAGMVPNCVTTCVGGAMYFGDRNNHEGLAARLLSTYRSVRMKVGLGTEPRVYYLVDDGYTAESLNTCMACHR